MNKLNQIYNWCSILTRICIWISGLSRWCELDLVVDMALLISIKSKKNQQKNPLQQQENTQHMSFQTR